MRGNSFVSGGFLPQSVRGTTFDGLVTAWDWYSTFSSLAGVDATDHRAAAAGLPPIDSHDMTDVIMGRSTTSPRTSVPLGTEPRPSNLTVAPPCASFTSPATTHGLGGCVLAGPGDKGRCTTVSGLIVDEGDQGMWKILTGSLQESAWFGPEYPNASTNYNPEDLITNCDPACLYNITEDPFEYNDLAAVQPTRVAAMMKRLEAVVGTAFNPHRGGEDPAACAAVKERYGGFWGWWID